ncbi:FAD-dependent monooxygenase [Nonomuraea polychroma]|uniref:FAD-dependent monooxygenase n=1 Tax=Nonomuraea polychroma TaxID=46176 RepID=UPI000FDDD8AA
MYDVVSQIRMPVWSTGRVALVGDAAYATSFMSAQGSSLSLVGAYVLADELARHGGHTTAFAAYEKTVRNFVEQDQAFATRQQFEARNAMLRSQTALPSDTQGRAAHTALTLPNNKPL